MYTRRKVVCEKQIPPGIKQRTKSNQSFSYALYLRLYPCLLYTSSCPKFYIDSDIDKTPDIDFIYEPAYVSTDKGLSGDIILRPGQESKHCDLYIKNIEKTMQDISILNFPPVEKILNNKPPISISADTSILNPLNDNRAPDPYLIRLMLSSFR